MFEPGVMKWFVWVPWFEWYYKINKHWRIISYRKRCQKWSKLMEEPQWYVKPRIKRSKSSKKDFLAVTLYDWIKKKKFYVSRLVAHLFMWYDLNDKSKQIIFKDWDPTNCDITNLHLWTVSERTFNWTNKRYNAEWAEWNSNRRN